MEAQSAQPQMPSEHQQPTLPVTPNPSIPPQPAVTPPVPQPPVTPPPASGTKLWIVFVILGIVVLAVVLILAWALFGRDRTSSSNNSESTTVQPSQSDLQDLSAYNGKTAAFGYPYDYPGWTNTVLGDEGVYQYKNNSGTCQLTFLQSTIA